MQYVHILPNTQTVWAIGVAGVLSYLQLAIMASTDQTETELVKSQLVMISHVHICLCALFLCQYVPVLCGVSYSSDELHSFGVVVDLSV